MLWSNCKRSYEKNTGTVRTFLKLGDGCGTQLKKDGTVSGCLDDVWGSKLSFPNYNADEMFERFGSDLTDLRKSMTEAELVVTLHFNMKMAAKQRMVERKRNRPYWTIRALLTSLGVVGVLVYNQRGL